MVDDLQFPLQDLQNKDYDDLAAGDETHRDGDTIPLRASPDNGEPLKVGDLFAVDSSGEAVPYTPSASADGEAGYDLAGVVYTSENDDFGPGTVEADATVASGERFTAKVQGTVIARKGNLQEGVGERTAEGALVLDGNGGYVHLLLP